MRDLQIHWDAPIDWDAAITELRKRGRCRNLYQNKTMNVCMLGAVLATVDLLVENPQEDLGNTFGAIGNDRMYALADAASGTLMEIIKEQFPERVKEMGVLVSVTGFNDHPATTDDDCFFVFEKARANG